MNWSVANWALVLAGMSFAAFVVGAIGNTIAQARTTTVADQAAQLAAKASNQGSPGLAPIPAGAPTVPELTELVKALTGAIEAIVRAGPALAGLAASVLFLGIAAWASVYGVGATTICTVAAQTPMEFEDHRLKAAAPVKCEPAPSIAAPPKK